MDKYSTYVLSLFRVVVGLLFAIHGASSVFGLFGGAMGEGRALSVGAWPGWWAAVIQLVVGVLVMVGLGTRWAALLGSGSMAYAYFSVHQEHAVLPLQNGGEPAVMFCWSLLLVAFLGSGRLAVDQALVRQEPPALEAPVGERVHVDR